MHLASLLGGRFSIISAGPAERHPSQRRRVYDQLKTYALDHKCASVRPVSISVPDVAGDEDEVRIRLSTQVRAAIEKDGADVVIVGCGLILGVEKAISEELNVPIIVPGIAALKVCELLIDMGLKQSKLCFAFPPEKERKR